MSSAVIVEQRARHAMRITIAVTETKPQLLNVLSLHSRRRVLHPYIKKEDEVKEYDNENYEIMTIEVK